MAWERRELRAGEAWLRVHDGAQVAVAEDGGPFFPVTDDRRLGPNDRVHVAAGRADLEMARSVDIEMRDGSDVVVNRTPVLQGGEVLVQTDGAPLRVADPSAASVTVAPRSIARVSRTLTYGASVYRGQAMVRSAGSQAPVRALRQASVSAVGMVSGRPLPILVDANDEWDRRYLGLAIELSHQLDAVSRGFSANVVLSTRPLADLVLDAIPSARRSSDLELAATASRRPGEVLVGTAIATAASSPFTGVFDFRDSGATWGLVALDQHIDDPDDLFRLLRLALDDAPIVVTEIAAPTTSSPPAPGTAPADSGAAAEVTDGAAATPGDPSTDDPLAPPATGTPLDPVIDDTTDDLAGVVEETEEIIVEPVTNLLEPLDDPLDDTTGTLADGVDVTNGSLLDP